MPKRTEAAPRHRVSVTPDVRAAARKRTKRAKKALVKAAAALATTTPSPPSFCDQCAHCLEARANATPLPARNPCGHTKRGRYAFDHTGTCCFKCGECECHFQVYADGRVEVSPSAASSDDDD